MSENKWINQHLPLNLRDFWERYKPSLHYLATALVAYVSIGGMAWYIYTQSLRIENALKEVEKQRQEVQRLQQKVEKMIGNRSNQLNNVKRK